jgi:ABC-type branched-subunit amino acid transport system ATPase component
MLHLHDIESGYGAGQVLFGVSLSVPAGHVVSLMGRNGMGKTTTIRTIMGQLPLTGGSISRFGNNQPDQLPFQIARLGVGLVAEGRQIFSNLNVTENLTGHRVMMAARTGIMSGFSIYFRGLPNAVIMLAIIFLVANSKCWPLAAP